MKPHGLDCRRQLPLRTADDPVLTIAGRTTRTRTIFDTPHRATDHPHCRKSTRFDAACDAKDRAICRTKT
jgi:hypothetical protein